MMPSLITAAPAGITPDAPRRGSVIAYAPRMMIVSVITLDPSQFGHAANPSRSKTTSRPTLARSNIFLQQSAHRFADWLVSPEGQVAIGGL
jgi:hypothetical protein